MKLSLVLSNILCREVCFNNGKYYVVGDDNKLVVFTTNQVISMVKSYKLNGGC